MSTNDFWRIREVYTPQRTSGYADSITRAIYNELLYRYKLRKHKKQFDGVESEIAAALAAEIAEEINKEILADLTKLANENKND